MQQGFIELGRFSRYYRLLFGEYPSETLGIHNAAARLSTVTGLGDRLRA
jgi:AraC family ethanolamine operon transcriptional activator